MKGLSGYLEFDSRRVNRLLRKSSIDAAVLALKIAVAVLALFLFFILVQEAISGFFETRSAISKLDAEVEAAPAAMDKKALNGDKVDYSAIVQSKIFGHLGTNAAAAPVTPTKPVSQIALDLIGTFISDGQAPYA